MATLLDRIFRRGQGKPVVASRPGVRRGTEAEADIDDAFLGRLRRASLASRRSLTSGLTGEHPSPRRASALEFADYRSYSPGDDFRRVDWNAYLRLDHLLVKLAEAPERVDLHLLLDGSKSMDWGNPSKFAYARRLSVGLAYVALSHMDAVNLMMLHGRDCFQVSRQESALATPMLVKAARSLHPDGTTSLDAALAAFAAQGHRRGVAVLISDLLSPDGYQKGIERISGGLMRPVVIHLLSPEEMDPSLEGDMELEDVETGESIQVSVDWATRNRYQGWLRSWFEEIEAFCARRGVAYLRVETSQSVEELLLGRLHREKVLR